MATVASDRNDAARRTGMQPAGGFTLIEVLVSLMLVAILASMVLTAVQGVTQTARIARTRSIIAIIDSALQEQFEAYKYRPLPVATPDLSTMPADGVSTFGYELLPSEAARTRLIMMRDLQRMEMPDRISDIGVIQGGAMVMNRPALITAIANPVIRVGDQMRRSTQRQQVMIDWYDGGKNVPSRFSGYYRRALPTWTAQHQGAECLYMILSSTFVGGAPAIQAIPPTNIGDTDNDGMPEILDGWGQPIAFIRWPSGYQLADSELSIDTSLPDDFDLFRSDFGFTVAGVDPPWSLRPLVLSAGRDGEFGVTLAPGTGAGVEVNFRYHAMSPAVLTPMTWPISPAAMGPEAEGRTGNYFFPDPYLRQVGAVVRPGTPFGLQSLRADNITNYQLAAE